MTGTKYLGKKDPQNPELQLFCQNVQLEKTKHALDIWVQIQCYYQCWQREQPGSKCFCTMQSHRGHVIPHVDLLGPITMDNLTALVQHTYDVKSITNQLRLCNLKLNVIFSYSITAISF